MWEAGVKPAYPIQNTIQKRTVAGRMTEPLLKHHSIRISMDGKGQWMDNVFIERLWRSLNYECV